MIDRDYSFGSPDYGAVLFHEIRSALYPLEKRPHVLGFISGLGGREVTVDGVTEMSELLFKVAKANKVEQPVHWIGVRG